MEEEKALLLGKNLRKAEKIVTLEKKYIEE